ncbi:N-acetyltransferase [Acinetobacter baumannii]|nr:N-acetyltransferase [Acinetobacter baumannii]
MGFEIRKFKDIDLNDSFFDSLKSDYAEFSGWFQKKSNETAIIHFDNDKCLNGFLYLKIENEALDIEPPQAIAKRLKVGTMKIDAHGTRLGERFIKKIFDYALFHKVEEIYVTIFEKHKSLTDLFKKYDFKIIGLKHSNNGSENVLTRKIFSKDNLASYPFINYKNNNIYFLSIYPIFHSRLFPDSILNNEDSSLLQDISPTNSIHKIYIAGMQGMENIQPNDIIVIYRTAEKGRSAYYSSVFTSICVVEEYKRIPEFQDFDDFYQYCRKYSIFDEKELRTIYKEKRYIHVLKMTYNIALNKRINRAKLIEMKIMSNDKSFYSGFGRLTYNQLLAVMKEGKVDESLIIN